jgi:hypothetical protein
MSRTPSALEISYDLIRKGRVKVIGYANDPLRTARLADTQARVLDGTKASDGFAGASDDHLFALKHPADELREVGLGFVHVDLDHWGLLLWSGMID